MLYVHRLLLPSTLSGSKITDKGVRRLGEGLEDIPPLFSGRGEDGAEDGKGLGAGVSAETAGDFLFELHHPQVTFGLIVGEGHVGVGQEPQGVVLVAL